MLAEYKWKTNLGVGMGLGIQIVPRLMLGPEGMVSLNPVFVISLFLLSFSFFIWGCMSYAKGKGHHPCWGFFGLLYIVGLFILFFLPDKHKHA